MGLPIRRGSDHHRALFTPDEVDEIRKSFDEDRPSYRTLARERHCSPDTIYRLVNRISYRPERRR